MAINWDNPEEKASMGLDLGETFARAKTAEAPLDIQQVAFNSLAEANAAGIKVQTPPNPVVQHFVIK